MSRSKHQTLKSVFGGKSASEIGGMIAGRQDDVLELAAKSRIKKTVRADRALAKRLPSED